MDPKELKKLQEKLKKDQEILKKDQVFIKDARVLLVDDQVVLKKALETLASDREAIVVVDNNLQLAQKELSEGQHELEEGFKALEAEKKRLGPLSAIEPVKELKVDPKWLKGQIFRGKKEGEPVKKAGKKIKTRVFIPFQRPLEAADILDFKVYGDEVVIVTADGRKFRVKK